MNVISSILDCKCKTFTLFTNMTTTMTVKFKITGSHNHTSNCLYYMH